jgi:hypothetical protein
MNLRTAIERGLKANLFYGGVYSLISSLLSYLLIRTLPAKDFAAYASALSASNIGVVMVEGGLTLGFTRYLPSATKEGIAATLYRFVLRRRVLMGLVGVAALTAWSASGWGHHALLDGYVGRWVWLCIGVMFFGELFSLLPFAGLQALFEYQYSLSTRAFFVAVRGGAVLLTWFALHRLYAVFLAHGACVILEGSVYHWWLRRKVQGDAPLSEEQRRQVLHYGYYSIVEKGANAAGGINGIFLIMGYLLPAEALGPIAIAKEVAQRLFALVILPINNLTNGVLNWSTDSADLPQVASRSLALMSAFVLLVSGLALGLFTLVLPALKLVRDPVTMTCAVIVFSGIIVEYVLRYDQSYRFRRGQMRAAVAWAYASAVAAIGLTIWCGARVGIAGALVAYFCGRLSVLATAVAYKLNSRYDSRLMRWLPALLGPYALVVAVLLWRPDGLWHWIPLGGLLGVTVAFAQDNREWLHIMPAAKRKADA